MISIACQITAGNRIANLINTCITWVDPSREMSYVTWCANIIWFKSCVFLKGYRQYSISVYKQQHWGIRDIY